MDILLQQAAATTAVGRDLKRIHDTEIRWADEPSTSTALPRSPVSDSYPDDCDYNQSLTSPDDYGHQPW